MYGFVSVVDYDNKNQTDKLEFKYSILLHG